MLISCQLTHSLGTLCSTLSYRDRHPVFPAVSLGVLNSFRCLFIVAFICLIYHHRKCEACWVRPRHRHRLRPGSDSGSSWGLIVWTGAPAERCRPHVWPTLRERWRERKRKRDRERVSPHSSLPCGFSVFFSALSLSLFSVINTYTETYICVYMLHFFTVIVPRMWVHFQSTRSPSITYDPLSCSAALPFEYINRCVFLLFSN